MIDYQVKLVSFPSGKVHETVVENEDGSYTIFIDKNLTDIQQKVKCLHALKHLVGDDFYKFDVDEIEKEAHELEFSEEFAVGFG